MNELSMAKKRKPWKKNQIIKIAAQNYTRLINHVKTTIDKTWGDSKCTLCGNRESVCKWPGRPGFNPRSSHSKDSKNGSSCLLA